MTELTATAERLRVVKDVYGDFLGLWAMECLIDQAWQSERFQRDLLSTPAASENSVVDLLSRRRLDD